MKKVFSYIKDHTLLIISLFILVFIPLYPKIPILDIKNTWVYIRIEDFIVLAIALIFGILLLLRKVTLKTPLTLPIFFFWGVGLLSTLYAIFFIFPDLANVHPMLAFLHYARRIEYIILFFVGFAAIRSKRDIKPIIIVLSITLFLVVAYGVGQKYFGFPAFLTGNEEFAKGAPLKISANARVPSTFAGHYDLAAWLVILIPLFGSMVFAFRKWWAKIVMMFAAFSGLIMLLMTASRVSFAMYLLSISFMLLLQKQKKWIIPVIVVSLIIMNSFQGIASRFGSTISQVDLVVDARTGKAIGVAKTTDETGKVIIEDIQSTGENLPEGTGFINVPTDGVKSTASQIIHKRRQITAGTEEDVTTELSGDFVVKRGYAYDVSFTTRFQGTWPRAINAFKRNIFTGSGYSSISLASDNNYLRILGEVGILGMASFLSIFLFYGIFVRRVLPQTDSKKVKSFVIGTSAGLFGLGLNATLIDVFEASKVAFVFWTLMGLTVGVLYKFQKNPPNYRKEIYSFLTSYPMIGVYFFITTFLVYISSIKNYFIGDDFTWLRWAAECKKMIYPDGVERCAGTVNVILSYFTDSNGFFFRPGTKTYFLLMYPIAWLNSPAYHVVSLLLHTAVAFGVFVLTDLITKRRGISILLGAAFLALAANFESVLWVAVTGHLIASACVIFGLIGYILSKKNFIFYIPTLLLTIAAPFFHEFGVVAPFIYISYDLLFEKIKSNKKAIIFWIISVLTIPIYLVLRLNANSHWSGGDYSYNIEKLPFNAIGNSIGYILVSFLGLPGMSIAQDLRELFRGNIAATAVFGILGAVLIGSIVWYQRKKKIFSKKILFGLVFFVLTLTPFLGLGNITYRYSYLPAAGLVLFIGMILSHIISQTNKKKMIAFYSLGGALFIGFVFFHIVQIEKVKKDWTVAGGITYNTVVGLYNNFTQSQATPPNPVFYFINTPIRMGEAWVYPVGLDDSLWFSFQNENLTVRQVKSLDEAFEIAGASRSARFFEFDKNGAITEIQTDVPFLPPEQ